MIKISNGITDKKVSQGAYENFYKPLGYHIIGEKEKPKREVETKEEIKVVEKHNIDKGEKKSPKVEEFKKR